MEKKSITETLICCSQICPYDEVYLLFVTFGKETFDKINTKNRDSRSTFFRGGKKKKSQHDTKRSL
jgi:hypothetical protein